MPYESAVGASHRTVIVCLGSQACIQLDACSRAVMLPQTVEMAAVQVPDGLLVFFPSYSVMRDCIEAWQMPSTSNNTWSGTIWDRILRQKLAVIEPQVLFKPLH